MATSTFSAKIVNLVGSFSDEDALDDWMAEGAKEIIHVLPEELKAKCLAATTLNNSTTTMDMDSVGKVLHVTRLSADSGGYQIPCREIPSMYGGLSTDSESLEYYGTATDPVYWVDGNNSDASTLYVKPTPTANQTSVVHHLSYPTVDASAVNTIANFPDEAEHLVVLYASIKALHQQMNSKQDDLPSDTVSPVLETITESLPSFTSPSDLDIPVKPFPSSLSAQSVTISGTAPTYIKPVFSAPTLGSVGSLILPTTPASPSLSVQTVDSFGTAPAYTKPPHHAQVAFSSYTSGLSETDPGILSITAATPAAPVPPSFSTPTIGAVTIAAFSSAPQYVKPSLTSRVAFSSYTSGLSETDPGTDIGITATSPAVPTLSAQTVDSFGTVPVYVKPAITSRVSFNTFFEDGSANPLDDSDPGVLSITAVAPATPTINTIAYTDATNIDALSHEITSATASAPSKADMDGNVPTFTKPTAAPSFGELGSYIRDEDLELASAKLQEISMQLNEYQANIQNEQVEFNKENVRYQANIQAEINKANHDLQVAIANANNLAIEYRQEAQQTTDVDKFNKTQDQVLNLTNASKTMEKLISDNNSIIQKYGAEVNVYQANVNKELQAYQQKLSRYTTELNTVYQAWAKTESDSLQEYNSNIQNELNSFNKDNVPYQATIQEKIQEAQLSDANEARKLQKYQAEVQTYQADINKQIQTYQQKLAQYQAELNTAFQAWSKTESDSFTQYSADIQNELNEFNKENVAYQADVQQNIQQAQLDATDAQQETSLLLQKENQEYASNLQKYQAELAVYQADVNTQVQEYTQKLSQYQVELNTSFQAWSKTESDNIQVFQMDMQNELNEFNKENVVYQATIQEKIQEAQLADTNEARKLQKYQAEVQTYQAEVNTKIQEWVNEEWNQNFQKYQNDYSSKLSEYSTNIQNELNEFNKENVEYQAKLQKDVQDAQLSDANEARKIQKYQAEVQTYGQELNTNVQKFTQELTKNRASFDTSLQKYTSEIQKVSSSNASILQKFTAEINDFSSKLQKQTTDYQWLQSQYSQLKADYQQGLQFLIGGGMPAQQQQQGE